MGNQHLVNLMMHLGGKWWLLIFNRLYRIIESPASIFEWFILCHGPYAWIEMKNYLCKGEFDNFVSLLWTTRKKIPIFLDRVQFHGKFDGGNEVWSLLGIGIHADGHFIMIIVLRHSSEKFNSLMTIVSKLDSPKKLLSFARADEMVIGSQ